MHHLWRALRIEGEAKTMVGYTYCGYPGGTDEVPFPDVNIKPVNHNDDFCEECKLSLFASFKHPEKESKNKEPELLLSEEDQKKADRDRRMVYRGRPILKALSR